MLLHLSIPPTPADPLGISKISGFYGNGTWASWFLTLASSWHGIVFEPASSSVRDVLDVLGHMLYTNWAAIDVFRQLHALESSNDEVENAVHGALGAALTITYLGVFHGFFQLCICWERKASGRRDVTAPERRGYGLRFAILLYGLILPSCALTAFSFRLPDFTSEPSGAANLLPVIYFDGIDEFVHFVAVYHACAVGQLVACFNFFLLLAEWELFGVSEETLIVAPFVALLFFLFSGGNYKLLG